MVIVKDHCLGLFVKGSQLEECYLKERAVVKRQKLKKGGLFQKEDEDKDKKCNFKKLTRIT